MAQRNREERNRSDYDRNRTERGEQYGRDDRDRYYEEGVGLRNIDENQPLGGRSGQSFRDRGYYGNDQQQDYGRGREDYNQQQDYGRTQHFDEGIAGRPSGFQGDYGYRAGSQSQFGMGGRFSNFGVGRNTSIGQSGYGSSESGRGFGRSHFGTGESWRSQFDNRASSENWRSQNEGSGSGENWRSQFNEGQNYTGRGPMGIAAPMTVFAKRCVRY